MQYNRLSPFKLILGLGLLILAGCTVQVEPELGGILTKEYTIAGERVLVGGEAQFGGTINNFNPE